jgi:K+-transporting ATPase ATPase C chain
MNRLPVFVRQHIAAFRALLVFTVLCGLIYPAVMVGVAQLVAPNHANGSMVSYNGRTVGSALLCQEFVDAKGNPLPKYFQPRPSNAVDATSKTDYGCNPLFSAASNLGPNNPDQIKLIKERQQAIASPRPGTCRSPRSRRWWTSTPRAGRSASWASRRSTCSS